MKLDFYDFRCKELTEPSTSRLCSVRKLETLSSGATPGSSLPNLDFDLSLEDVLNEEPNSGLIPKDILYRCRQIVESYISAIVQCSVGNSSQVFKKDERYIFAASKKGLYFLRSRSRSYKTFFLHQRIFPFFPGNLLTLFQNQPFCLFD